MKKAIVVIIVLPILLLVGLALVELSSMYRTHQMDEITYEPTPPAHWPLTEWAKSTPEEQGMDSKKLVELIHEYRSVRQENGNIQIDSISIIRNGYLVADIYFNPYFPPDTKHIINSCTKSIMSILIGIAIEQGHIPDVNVPVLNILDDPEYKTGDKRMESLTLKHLLAMRTGLRSQDSYLYGWRGLFEMQATDDWIKHVLNLPLEVEPGSRFEYSNMASFLLSAIIARSTGTDTLSFARKNLFEPLGIKDVKWEQSPKGIDIGFAGMWLKPHDMAKIGLLYLQKGKWQERQVVSSRWVEESIQAHSFPEQYRFIYDENGEIDFGKSGAAWTVANLSRPFSDGYGYQWWLDESGLYTALGVGGQYLVVAPKLNLVVAVTSKLGGADSFFPIKLLKDYIIPSAVANKEIPANKKAQAELIALSTPPGPGTAQTSVPKLPAMAAKISGQTYRVETSLKHNPWRYHSFRLDFEAGKDHAMFQYRSLSGRAGQNDIRYKIGLDQTYRQSRIGDDTYVAAGKWIAPDTFFVEYERVGYSHRGKWKLKFHEGRVFIEETGVTGEYQYCGAVKSKSCPGR